MKGDVEMPKKLTPEQIRHLLGYNRKEMAKELGCSETTIYRKEQGKTKWSLLEIEKLSRLYDIPIKNIKVD